MQFLWKFFTTIISFYTHLKSVHCKVHNLNTQSFTYYKFYCKLLFFPIVVPDMNCLISLSALHQCCVSLFLFLAFCFSLNFALLSLSNRTFFWNQVTFHSNPMVEVLTRLVEDNNAKFSYVDEKNSTHHGQYILIPGEWVTMATPFTNCVLVIGILRVLICMSLCFTITSSILPVISDHSGLLQCKRACLLPPLCCQEEEERAPPWPSHRYLSSPSSWLKWNKGKVNNTYFFPNLSSCMVLLPWTTHCVWASSLL